MHRTAATAAAFSTALAATFGSSIAVGAQDAITAEFEIASSNGTLIVALYLVGCSIGPFLYAPIGEIFGRKYALGGGVSLMLVFAIAAAVAPSWNALLVFRFFAGVGSAAPMTVSAGIVADIFCKPATRGYVVSCLMAATTIGSLVASVISLQIMGKWRDAWRMCFWIHAIVSGVSWLTVFTMPETNSCSVAASDAEHHSSSSITLQRFLLPFRMALFEPIVFTICLFLSLEYSIFYLFFQLIPPLFTELGYVGDQNSGLLFVPFIVGTLLACLGYIIVDPALRHVANRNMQRSVDAERRRLPPAYLGGFFIVLSLFLIGYCTGSRAHFAYSLVLMGVFGLGFLLIFIGLTNYIVDAYQTLASSALASSFFIRNVMGAALPLVAEPMRHSLGSEWSFYVLGLLSLPLAVVICGFHYYGPWLRTRSPLCQGSQSR
ncbi:hypothetical protein J1614_009461 [Plenodomus biglobosus]|nr:hypothetical protein J1614_009461 [Plenodomus biglobosus]